MWGLLHKGCLLYRLTGRKDKRPYFCSGRGWKMELLTVSEYPFVVLGHSVSMFTVVQLSLFSSFTNVSRIWIADLWFSQTLLRTTVEDERRVLY